ncbi:hypothetical protein D3C80_1004840 [compost metagenome]
MGEKCAGGIKFLAVDDHMVAGINELRLEVRRPFRAEFGKGVAETRAAQHLCEQQRLLGLIGHCTDRRNDAEMVLRDLPNR